MADDVLLRSSRSMRVAGAVLAVPAAAIAFVMVISRDAGPGALLLGVVAAALCIYVAVVLAFAGWRVGDDGLERRTPLQRRLLIPWDDVALVREGLGGSVILRYGFGEEVEVSHRLTGVNDLRRRVLDCAPSTALSVEVRGSLIRRLERAVDGAHPRTAGDAPLQPVAAAVQRDDALARWRNNPFFVLGLAPECSRVEVERAGQKLLALLAIGSGPARRFTTPLGEGVRTEDAVRAAMGELRDPERRLVHEIWARATTVDAAVESSPGEPSGAAPGPWRGARAAIGWRAP